MIRHQKNGWVLHIGHQGMRTFVFRDSWDVTIKEDVLIRGRRFRVIERGGACVSRYHRLMDAKREVLARLEAQNRPV